MTTHQSLALGFFIAIGLVLGVCGEHFEVTSAQQLIKVLNISEANHFDASITLLDDLDFSDSALTLPFGVSSDGSCVSYTGVFEGNGHTIKGLVMNNEDNQGYNNAGLFCALGNATFENLVIDSSCSFTGYSYAGALSVSLTGSLDITNVTNKAAVSGDDGAGGFVGIIQSSSNLNISFSNSVSNGIVTGIYGMGGFVGMIQSNSDLNISFSYSINNGIVTGSYIMGGFVGVIYENNNMKMTISNCVNNGLITGIDGLVGGFTGGFWDNRYMEIIISNCVNNGQITGELAVGGFVGGIEQENGTSMILFNCTNTGEINGTDFIGGLVGFIGSELDQHSVSFSIISSANKGNVLAVSFACGMICVYFKNRGDVNGTVLNSINKGSVKATTNAYGITDTITKARNVVSMGEVTASGSFTFWNISTDVDLFFGLDGKCVNCTGNTTLFVHNTSTGFYEVVGSGKHVHDLLNAEVEKQNYGMVWTKELELVEPGQPSGGNKHGVSLFWVGVVVALAVHVAMAQ